MLQIIVVICLMHNYLIQQPIAIMSMQIHVQVTFIYLIKSRNHCSILVIVHQKRTYNQSTLSLKYSGTTKIKYIHCVKNNNCSFLTILFGQMLLSVYMICFLCHGNNCTPTVFEETSLVWIHLFFKIYYHSVDCRHGYMQTTYIPEYLPNNTNQNKMSSIFEIRAWYQYKTWNCVIRGGGGI